jgi:hypothetical protein
MIAQRLDTIGLRQSGLGANRLAPAGLAGGRGQDRQARPKGKGLAPVPGALDIRNALRQFRQVHRVLVVGSAGQAAGGWTWGGDPGADRHARPLCNSPLSGE